MRNRPVRWDGSGYNREEIAFMMAMDGYKTRNKRPFPTWVEVLTILRRLGYRRVEPPDSDVCRKIDWFMRPGTPG